MRQYKLENCPRCNGNGYYSAVYDDVIDDTAWNCDHQIGGTDTQETLDMVAGLIEANKLMNGLK